MQANESHIPGVSDLAGHVTDAMSLAQNIANRDLPSTIHQVTQLVSGVVPPGMGAVVPMAAGLSALASGRQLDPEEEQAIMDSAFSAIPYFGPLLEGALGIGGLSQADQEAAAVESLRHYNAWNEWRYEHGGNDQLPANFADIEQSLEQKWVDRGFGPGTVPPSQQAQGEVQYEGDAATQAFFKQREADNSAALRKVGMGYGKRRKTRRS